MGSLLIVLIVMLLLFVLLLFYAAWIGLCLAPFGIAFLVWWKTRSLALCVAALVAALALPNLRPLTTWAVFMLKAREPNHEILKVVERPESLFIQNDLQSAPFGIGLREPDRDGDMVETLDAPYRWEDHVETLWAYLDGERLTALALTTDEGEIRLFRGAVAPFFERNARCGEERRAAEKEADALEAEARNLAEKTGVAALEDRARTLRNKREECRALWQEDVKALQRSAQEFKSEADLPPMRYRMRLHQETVWFLRPRWPLYHVHHMEIRDTQSGERIAWARRHYAPVWWFTRLSSALFLRDNPPQSFVKGPGDTPLAAVAMRAFGREPRDNWEKLWEAKKAAGLSYPD